MSHVKTKMNTEKKFNCLHFVVVCEFNLSNERNISLYSQRKKEQNIKLI